MSQTRVLSTVRQKILLSMTTDRMDFQKLVETAEVYAPELNYHLVRLGKLGLVAYDEDASEVSLTEKGKQVASELRSTTPA